MLVEHWIRVSEWIYEAVFQKSEILLGTLPHSEPSLVPMNHIERRSLNPALAAKPQHYNLALAWRENTNHTFSMLPIWCHLKLKYILSIARVRVMNTVARWRWSMSLFWNPGAAPCGWLRFYKVPTRTIQLTHTVWPVGRSSLISRFWLSFLLISIPESTFFFFFFFLNVETSAKTHLNRVLPGWSLEGEQHC